MHADDLESLLATAIQSILEGASPDARALAGGDEQLVRRLEQALEHALAFLPEPEPAALPAMIGPYAIERELGRGGMGVVLLGRHVEMGRRAAIKILPRPYSLVPENRERFRREARAMASVRHPNVLPIHEVGEADGVPFAALEYAEGATLEDLLRSLRGLDLAAALRRGAERLQGADDYESRVASLLAPVADALYSVHGKGIVHRDVKPSNILLDGHGAAYLGDFGLALVGDMDSLTHSGALVGTRHYLAPELLARDAQATPASDLYALGITLYELVTLRAPFSGDSEDTLFRAIREREPKRPSAINRRVSPELEAVCLKAIDKSPALRYASGAEFAADLRAAARGAPVTAPHRGRIRRAARTAWFHRRRIGLAVLVVLVALAVPLAAWLSWRNREAAAQADFTRRLNDAQAHALGGDPLSAEALFAELCAERPEDRDAWTGRIVNMLRPPGASMMSRQSVAASARSEARAFLSAAPEALCREPAGRVLAALVADNAPPERDDRAWLPAGVPAAVDTRQKVRLALVLARARSREADALSLLREVLAEDSPPYEATSLFAALTWPTGSAEGYRAATIAQWQKPTLAGPLIMLARFHLSMAKDVPAKRDAMLAEGLAMARRAVELAPQDARIGGDAAYILQEAKLPGWEAEAEALYRHAIALGPNPLARWNLRNLLQGVGRLKPRELLTLFEPIEASYGHWASYWMDIAWARAELEGAEAALAPLERGLLHVDASEAHKLLVWQADFHADLGGAAHREAGLEAWDRAFDLAPDKAAVMDDLLSVVRRFDDSERLDRWAARCRRLRESGLELGQKGEAYLRERDRIP